MSIRFKCECGAHHQVREALAGKNATCKECGRSFMIPVKPADFEGKGTRFDNMPDMSDGAKDPPPF